MHAVVSSSPLPVAKPSPPSSSLPDGLIGPSSILWTWVVPIFVLCILNGLGYRLISDSFEESHRRTALLFGLANLLNLALGIGAYAYALTRVRAGHTAPGQGPFAGVLAMAVQASYLILTLSIANDILPPSVQTWLYPGTRFLFNQASFAMLPFVAGLLQFSCSPMLRFGRTMLQGLGCALSAPLLFYFALQLAGRGLSTRHLQSFVMVSGMVLIALLVVVLLVRFMMRAPWLKSKSVAHDTGLVVTFAVVLPVIGLVMNQGMPFPAAFHGWEVWALTALNAFALFWAVLMPKRWPRVTLALVSAMLPFSLYFFFAFLPYVPLGLLAILLFGLGFLILSPTFLLVVHARVLLRAWQRVIPLHSRREVLGLALACGLILPGFVVARAVGDRIALRAALDHVYEPTVKQGEIAYQPSLTLLRGALANHRDYKNGNYLPLLSDFYSWAVFDNLVLSDQKIARLDQVFFGSAPTTTAAPQRHFGRGENRRRAPRAAPAPKTVSLTRLAVKAASAGAGDTTVTLAFTLTNTGAWPAEYVTALPLPPGVFVNGFRLHVHGVPVPGRITEKKTALWVYTTIRDIERRDPGLLVYTAPDALELSVFPVETKTPSIVEIDFLVPAEVGTEISRGLHLDPAAVLRRLGTAVRPQRADTPQGTAIVGLDRLALPPVEREPYLHLIVDRSQDNPFRGDVAQALRDLSKRFPAAKLGRVTLANHNVASLVSPLTPLAELPERMRAYDHAMAPAGGLLLDLALAHGLRQHATQELDAATPAQTPPPRPIFVVLGKTAAVRTMDLPLATAWADVAPGLEVHEYGDDGTFRTSLAQSSATATAPLVRAGKCLRPVRGVSSVRFAATPEPVEYWSAAERRWQPATGLAPRTQPGAWGRAMSLLLRQHDAERNPGGAGDDRRSLLLAGRETGLLTHATSYIVVENAAQWKMLEVGERKKLSQSDALDHVETPAPGWVWLAGGFAAWLVVRRWRQSRSASLTSIRQLS